ncbi:efflux RND transporter permease subunit [Cognatishimia activa]|uniref:efflux RND transporter permease subunit n=1 Tax=Cognatishimia activa TaxID=1715691 RepID=UPI00222FEBCA|nr:efflux RND transporter permease subunit [Cognatishimia activa]UZD90808.1 efflux RND transporter permease subunit [Cognatishimia activa]
MPKRNAAQLVVSHPRAILAATLLLVSIAATGLQYIGMSPDLRVFFSDGNPDKIALDDFEEAFVREDSGIIAIAAKSGDVFTPDAIRAVHEVVERAWYLPYVRRIDSVITFQDSRAEDDAVLVGDLVPDPLNADQAELDVARARALQRPEIVGSLLNPDASMTQVRVLFMLPGLDLRNEAPEAYRAMLELEQEIEAEFPEIEILVSGTAAMNASFTLAARQDLKTLLPAMVFVAMLILGLSLRSFRGAAIALTVSLISALSGISALCWAGVPLNTATVMAPLIILTLSVAGVTHLLSATGSATEGLSATDQYARQNAVADALQRLAPSITLSLITTIIGFLALNFSISPPFWQLGNAVAAGLFVALLLILTLVPALVVIWPPRSVGARHHHRGLTILAQWTLDHKIVVLLVSALIVSAIIPGIARLQFEDDFVAYFDESFQFRRDTDQIEENLTGLRTLEYPFDSGQPEGVYNPAFLTQVDAFVAWARTQPNVVSVQSVTDTIKQLSMNMNEDEAAAYRLPDARASTAQYVLLYEMSLGYGMDLSDRLSMDKSALRATVVLQNVTTADTRHFEEKAAVWIAANAPLLSADPTGIAHVFTLIAFRDAKAMVMGTLLALALVSVAMMVLLRNPRLALISLVPNLLPAALAFGLWGFISGQVTLAISVVAAMTFGIVVDDTIHMMMAFNRNRRAGKSNQEASVAAVSEVGRPVLITSLSLMAGFFVMSFSGFALNSDMALLTACTVGFAVLADLFLLPVLLSALARRDRPISTEELTVLGEKS